MSRIEGCARVTALPVHAAFPFPLQPEFRFSDFLSLYGPSNLDGSNIETDPIADCVHARPKMIPHTQWMDDVPTAYVGARARFDPRAYTADTPYNIAWTLESYSGGITTSKDWGAHGPGWGIGAASGRQQPFKYLVLFTDCEDPVNPPDLTPFTFIAKTSLKPYNGLDAYGNATFGSQPMCQGFWASLTRGVYDLTQGWVGPDAAQFNAEWWWQQGTQTSLGQYPGYSAIRFRIGCGVDALWFEIKFVPMGPPEVYYTDDGTFADKTLIQSLKYSGAGDKTYGESERWMTTRYMTDSGGFSPTDIPEKRFIGAKRTNHVKVKLIGGYLQIEVEGEVQPFVWRVMLTATEDQGGDGDSGGSGGSCNMGYEANDPIGLIEEIKVVFVESHFASWWVQPMKWDQEFDLTSKLINIGFIPTTTAELTAHHAFYTPPVYSFNSTYALQGTNIRYSILVYNDSPVNYPTADYSDATVALRSVSIAFPEVLRSRLGRPVMLEPESVIVNQSFNISDLSVTTTASLTFNNFKPLGDVYENAPDVWWGEWSNYSGVVAIKVEAIVNEYDDASGDLIGSSGWVPLFTGYGNIENTIGVGSGKSQYTMQCVGRELSMMQSSFNLPWMDGWNEYYAVAYLANSNGVKKGTPGDSDLDFINQVPPDPYNDSPGGGAYFLPMGNGGTPLQKFASGSKAWQVLGKMAVQSGFVRYFDAYGKLHWEKFNPEPVAPEIIFTVDYFAPEPFDAKTVIFDGQVKRNLSGVRNQTTIIGVDAHGPLWLPTVSHRSDAASIYEDRASIWEESTANYLGFKSSFVWIDSQFANRQYTAEAADRIHALMRIPDIQGSYNSWLNLGVYPGRWVGLVDVKSGLYDRFNGLYLSMLVMGASHIIKRGQVPTTSMRLRYIPRQS